MVATVRKHHPRFNLSVLAISGLFANAIPFQVIGAEFCVNSLNDLKAALSVAGTNGESDIIRIASGTYQTNIISDFSSDASSLTIEGGFSESCSLRSGTSILDGGGASPAIGLVGLQGSDLTVRNLTFQNTAGSYAALQFASVGDFTCDSSSFLSSAIGLRGAFNSGVMSNCAFAGNQEAVADGSSSIESWLIEDSVFSDNGSFQLRGRQITMRRTAFLRNSNIFISGRGVASFDSVEVRDNVGSMSISGFSQLNVNQSTFDSNPIGLLTEYCGMDIVLEGNTFSNNSNGASMRCTLGCETWSQCGDISVSGDIFNNNVYSALSVENDGFGTGLVEIKEVDITGTRELNAPPSCALRILSPERVSIFNSRLVDNRTGGACLSAKNIEVFDSEFSGNGDLSEWSGAVQLLDWIQTDSAEIARNRFSGNRSSGGGAIASESVPVRVFGNEFIANEAKATGGALYYSAVGEAMRVHANYFSGNRAGGQGGAIGVRAARLLGGQQLGSEIANNIFVENQSMGGGAIHVDILGGSDTRVLNNTLVRNSATEHGGGVSAQVIDSVGVPGRLMIANTAFWRNTSPSGSDLYLRLDQNFDFYADAVSDVRSNMLDMSDAGTTLDTLFGVNFELNLPAGDPRLDGIAHGDFSPSANSLLLDAGNIEAASALTVDFQGDTRVQGVSVDIGAVEARPVLALTSGKSSEVASLSWSEEEQTFVGRIIEFGAAQNVSTLLLMPDSARALATIGDISGNGIPELAALGVSPESKLRIQIRDGGSGEFIRNQLYFEDGWHALGMEVLPDLSKDGAEDLAVLAENPSSGEIAVQIRDAATGAFTANVFFLNESWRALQLLTFGEVDDNPGPELGVLATNDAGQIVVMLKDAKTNTFIKNVFFLNANWEPIQAIVLDDISENGAQEIGLLAKNKNSGQLVVMVKDAATNTFLNNVFPLGSGWDPVKVLALPDENANGSQELAVLGVNEATGKLVVQVRDSLTGQFLRNLEPLGSNWDPKDLVVLPDIGGGIPGLSVLATRKSDDLPVVQTIEAISGDLITNVVLN